MKSDFYVNRYYVSIFDSIVGCLVQYSPTMSLDNCRLRIKVLREKEPSKEFSITAVLDE